MKNVRKELKRDVIKVRLELRKVRLELKKDIIQTRLDLKRDIKNVVTYFEREEYNLNKRVTKLESVM